MFGDFPDLVGRVTADVGDGIGLRFVTPDRVEVMVGGTMDDDGSIEVGGTVSAPRRRFDVHGRAVASRDEGSRRIVVTIRAVDSFIDFATTFTFETALLASPLPFAGAERLAFDPSPSGCACGSTASLSITTPVTGFGSSDLVASDADTSGEVLGGFDPGECDVTASGRVFCQLRYQRTPDLLLPVEERPVVYARLFGRLSRSGNARPTTGRYVVDLLRNDYLPLGAGSFTATRLD